ncbi:Os07g0451101 [Oryza sativa Japonica Group]|uniref:Os07g0451101 protein n=1 Tax=Oryza sativa subsp. japonica TaxID=39947 RepID=C7J4I7_ORYSJ|nr:Os07g0451101 [Oryza sativa Japonica Group]|eukprot:NP_001175179.1 Os07g0451101 [Oryza sativa Japonica Group]
MAAPDRKNTSKKKRVSFLTTRFRSLQTKANPAAGNDCLDEEFDVTCDVADFQDGSN